MKELNLINKSLIERLYRVSGLIYTNKLIQQQQNKRINVVIREKI